jgi:hypothetical protein
MKLGIVVPVCITGVQETKRVGESEGDETTIPRDSEDDMAGGVGVFSEGRVCVAV